MTERKLFLVVSVFLLVLTMVRVFAADIKTQSLIQYHWCNDPFQKIVFPGNKVDFFR